MANKYQIQVQETKALLDIIKQYPLATVMTHLGESVEISHLPVVAEEFG